MNDHDQPAEVPSPIGIAALSCLACFGLIYWAAKPLVGRLEVFWVEFLAYALPALAVTFVILYRSGWHREMARMARTGYFVWVSSLILGSDLLLIGTIIAILSMCAGIGRVGP